MKSLIIISKTHGTHEVFMDDGDFEVQSKFKWCIKKHHGNWYARRRKGNIQVTLHQEIMGKKEGFMIDHKDMNGLKCTRENMRHCTVGDNNRNSRSRKGTSKYLGVYWDKEMNKWGAIIRINGKQKRLGRFKDEEAAARCRDYHALIHYGKITQLNFPIAA